MSSFHSITLFLLLFAEKSITDDLFHALDAIHSLRIDKIHQVVVIAIEQEIFDVVGSI